MITDLKELKALFALCRKQGVTEIKVGDCHVKFGELSKHDETKEETPTERSFDDLTEEERMFYSAEGAQA